MEKRLPKKKVGFAKRLWQNTAQLHTAQAMYFCSLLILLLIASTITVASVMHLCHIPIGVWTLPLAMLVTIALYLGLCGGKLSEEMRYGLYSFLITFVILTFFCGLFYEMSWDGNAYHKPTVGALANGWNPIYSSLDDYLKEKKLLALPASPAIWADHYAKASWLFAASVYKITGNIECGKVYNPLMVLALFCMTAHYFLQHSKFTRKQALTLSAFTAINPITLPQLLSYTNDGFLCSTLLLVILCLGTLTDKNYQMPKRFQWCAAICGILICVNIKFTGLAYVGVFCILFYFLHILREEKGKRLRKAVRLFFTYTAVFVFAVLIIGSSSYVKNTLDHQNPFYPLMGKGAVDIIYTNEPDSFNDMSAPEKLLRATFSKTENLTRRMHKEPEWKLPFLVFPKEFIACGAPDTRIGGFGPWFSGILLVCLGVIIASLGEIWKQQRFLFYVLTGNLLLIFLLLFNIKDSWWARYSPYFYLIPLLGYAISCVHLNQNQCRNNRWLTKLLTIALICNTAFFVPALLRNLGTILVYIQDVYILKEKNPAVYFDNYYRYTGIYYNLKDLHMDFTVTTKKPEHAKSYYLLATQYESNKEDGAFMQWIKQIVEQIKNKIG